MHKKLLLNTFFILIIVTQNVWGDTPTLSSIEQYAQTLDEFPANETENLLNPDYSSYQTRITPGFWKALFNRFQGKQPFWTKESLRESLEKAQRVSPYVNKNLVYLSLKPGDQIIVWGDIHGTFHSLIRCLKHLKEEGIIDNELKIQKQNIKLIFMGNIIDRSAYSLDTLMLVLTLINQNPQQVLYMRGSHEANGEWLNYDFKREIAVRLSIKSLTDPFVQLFNQFFSALPSQIFANLQKDPSHFLVFNSLYSTPTSALIKIKPEIDILLASQSHSHVYQNTEGLNMLPPEEGIPTWTLFSSPSLSFQKLYKFYNDDFTTIDIGPTLSSSTITLNRHDVRSKSSNFIKDIYQITSGQPLESKEFKQIAWLDLTLGSSLDFSESSRILGQRLKSGMDLRIRKLNREGGILGKLLRIYFENDQNVPSLTIKNANNLIEKGSKPILMTTLGNATTNALLPLAEEQKLLLMFPYTGDSLVRKPDQINVLNYRPSYDREIHALIKYAREKLLKQSFAIFYSDTFGKQEFETVKKMLQEKYNISSDAICDAPYPKNTINVNKAAEAIKNCNPDAILLLSSYDAAKVLVNRLGVAFLKNVTLLGYSFLTDQFKDFVGKSTDHQQQAKGLDFVISHVTPDPNNDQSEIVKEYRAEMDRVYPGARYDSDSLEGYINASILIDVLKQISPPYTNEKIIHAIESMKSYPFHGLTLNFNPSKRELSNQVWLDTGHKNWQHVDFD